MNALQQTRTKKISRRPLPAAIDLPDTIHPVLKRVFAARNIQSRDDLDYSLAGLCPFHKLSGIEAAVGLLQEALAERAKILIVADFDADGATSCALAIRALTMMGCDNIVYVVPNRFEYGYGLSPELVDVALEYDPQLLITVDNGISSIDGVAYARASGLKVVVTDHHLPGAVLPDAGAIVNPQLTGDQFPSKNLAGVGVIFYVLLALRASLRESGWFDDKGIACPNLAKLLDLVALGTVADVVPLDKNNRIMVAHGLKLIRRGQTVPGILALLRRARRSVENLSAADLGFSVAPRLNAAGRLTDMSLGIECLLTDDTEAAAEMAGRLDDLNRKRRQIQDEMQAEAIIELEGCVDIAKSGVPDGICLYKPDWHQGVIGILAAKVKEQFNRPVVAFARERDGVIKGSARSISGLHIRDLLEETARRNPELILAFGGHAMAAGLTINESCFERFSGCFNDVLKSFISTDLLQDEYLTDGEITARELSYELAEAIQAAGPWGQAFPEPLFEGHFKILGRRVVGNSHLRLRLQADDQVVDAIAFNTTDENWPANLDSIHSVYRLGINDYYQDKRLQLFIEYLIPC